MRDRRENSREIKLSPQAHIKLSHERRCIWTCKCTSCMHHNTNTMHSTINTLLYQYKALVPRVITMETYQAYSAEEVGRYFTDKLVEWSGVGHGPGLALLPEEGEEGEVGGQGEPGSGREGGGGGGGGGGRKGGRQAGMERGREGCMERGRGREGGRE